MAALVPVVSAQDEGADAASLGRQLFDEHLAYLMAGDVDGMVDNLYTDDAVLITPFDVLDTPPPNIVRGNGAIKAYFRLFVVSQGDMNLEDIYDFAQTDNSISFQMIFTSRTGRWVVGNAWHLTRGKIDTQYTFAQRLGDAPR